MTKLSSVKQPYVEETRKSRKARAAKYPGVYEHFLGQLIAAREELDLTQRQVSKKMGRSANFMSKCESGDRSIDVMELVELAMIYKKSACHFLPS